MPSPKSKRAARLAHLNSLADSFCKEIAEGGEAVVIHVIDDDGQDGDNNDGVQVHTIPLEGKHPTSVLMGLAAPEHTAALGVAVRGWAHALDPDERADEPMRRITNVVLVTRKGEAISRLQMGSKICKERPSHGAVLDCLLRTFDLPTPPPSARIGLFFATAWLEDAMAEAGRAGRSDRKLQWVDICRLHPAFKVVGMESAGQRPNELDMAALALERACDCDRLRWLVVEGTWPGIAMTGTEAAWMDAGMFSRWALDGHFGLLDLLDGMEEAAGTALARRCSRVLQRIGLLGRNEWRPSPAAAARA